LFESRADTFRESQVLQENVITASRKDIRRTKTVSVSISYGCDLTPDIEAREIPTYFIFDDSMGDVLLRIPENAPDLKIIRLVDSWPARFAELGLRVSTGPVVSFRARHFLLDSVDGDQTTPLLSLHNVRPFSTAWPAKKKGRPSAFKVCGGSLRLLVPTKNYVLLRRFSAKEDRRRLTASCFLQRENTRPYIALENHLNYIYHASRQLTENEVYGIAAIFNSVLLDRYFRTVSGNTQVNAAEIRNMKFPDLEIISRIGARVRNLAVLTPRTAEEVVLEELSVDADLTCYLNKFSA
jgi:adenine-specific DNA-methyltransferase